LPRLHAPAKCFFRAVATCQLPLPLLALSYV
jgi:hypothetical protein